MAAAKVRQWGASADRAGGGKAQAFHLLRYFSIASFIVIACATALLTELQHRLAVDDLIQTQEQNHVLLTQSVAQGHWPEFAALLTTAARLENAALRRDVEILRIRRLLQGEFAGTKVLKVKVYDPSGRTVFSSDESQIGEDKAANIGFRRAISGVPVSELTHRNQFSAFEQTVEDIDVISTYVPVMRDGGGRPVGVFEIYSDTSALVDRINQTRSMVAFQVTAVLVVLYLLLFLIVWRADRVIRRQERRRTKDERRLQAAREEIDRSEQFHRALIEHSSDAVMLLGRDRRVRYAAPADSRVLGIAEDELPGMLLADYVVPECRIAVEDWLRRVEKGEGEAVPMEFDGMHAATGRRHFVATATNLLGHPAVCGIVVNVRDFTERKRAELQVRRHALFDDLTGLARREYFVQQLNAAVAQATRRSEMLAVMFIDLDGFKQVNDSLGHEAGDLLLKAVAGRMRAILREEDAISRGGMPAEDTRIARLGGDEFTVLLTGLCDAGDAEGVAWRLLATIAAPYEVGGSKVRVTASIGIAIFPDAGATSGDLLKNADAAMYAAKQRGKNACAVFPPAPAAEDASATPGKPASVTV